MRCSLDPGPGQKQVRLNCVGQVLHWCVKLHIMYFLHTTVLECACYLYIITGITTDMHRSCCQKQLYNSDICDVLVQYIYILTVTSQCPQYAACLIYDTVFHEHALSPLPVRGSWLEREFV